MNHFQWSAFIVEFMATLRTFVRNSNLEMIWSQCSRKTLCSPLPSTTTLLWLIPSAPGCWWSVKKDNLNYQDPGNLLLAPIPLSSPPPGINVVQQDNLPVVPPGPLPAASKAIGKSVVASNKGSNPLRSKKAGILVSKNSFSHHAKSATSSKVLRLTGVSKSSTRSLLDRSNHQGVQLADDSHPSIPIIAIAGANSKDGHVAMVE
ncbi:hypothetical protein V6N12_007118 [Hibiscus sabdariffa]|uniref:Uncharacterized protein n=1 Tax=Hibiscus sabdariffa TaxID=183260 RepID=A0ABR2F0W3_9ROSI